MHMQLGSETIGNDPVDPARRDFLGELIRVGWWRAVNALTQVRGCSIHSLPTKGQGRKMRRGSAPQVEGLKQLSALGPEGDTSGESNVGDWPKRLRGYHRALKRGKPWAVKLSKLSGFYFVFAWHYGRPSVVRRIQESLIGPSLFPHIERDESWVGSSLPVPFFKQEQK